MLTTLVIFAVLGFWYLGPMGYRAYAERRLRNAVHGSLVLTYDDGPGESLTEALIDLLARENLKATFFLIGEIAGRRAGKVDALLQAGHELGSHTQTHLNAWKVVPWQAVTDMQEGRQTIERLGGKGTLFRPPYGKLTLAGLVAARRWTLGWWTIDPQDSWAPRPIDDVLAEVTSSGGGVVLMHDFDRPKRGGQSAEAHHDYVLELTRRLIMLAQEHRWPVRTLGDVLSHG